MGINWLPLLGVSHLVIGAGMFRSAFDHLPRNSGLARLVGGIVLVMIGCCLVLNY